MDLFERMTVDIDFGAHGCPGVTVKIRQMARADAIMMQQLRKADFEEPGEDATPEEVESITARNQAEQEDREEKITKLMIDHVLGISGLHAGGQIIDTMQKLMDVADSPEVVPGLLDPLITGITTEMFVVSSKSAADLGNSQPLSDSGKPGSDGTVPNAS